MFKKAYSMIQITSLLLNLVYKDKFCGKSKSDPFHRIHWQVLWEHFWEGDVKKKNLSEKASKDMASWGTLAVLYASDITEACSSLSGPVCWERVHLRWRQESEGALRMAGIAVSGAGCGLAAVQMSHSFT